MYQDFADLVLVTVEMPKRAVAPPDAGGPGWYESSWDLRRGLDVEVHLDIDVSPWRRNQTPLRIAAT